MVFIAASIYKFLFEAMLNLFSKNRKAYIYPQHNLLNRQENGKTEKDNYNCKGEGTESWI